MLRGMSDPDKIGLVTLMRLSDAEARAMLEAMRWPDGPVCPHCGTVGGATRLEKHKATSKAREGLWQCKPPCGKQFSVTVGTIFEGSHIPLGKWLAAIHMLSSSKKSVSAAQVQRQLELGSYRSAWHLCHRVRHMLANTGPLPPLKGTVEADETWLGGKMRPQAYRQPDPDVSEDEEYERKDKHRIAVQKAWRKKRVPVAVLVSREDGQARTQAMTLITAKGLREFVFSNVDVENSALRSDELLAYRPIGRKFKGGHESVNHSDHEYARGDVHSNTAESFHALFKRAYHGAWHHISREHASRYLTEATFRWSNRDLTDWQRTQLALLQADGVRLYYRKPRRQGEDEKQSLVAGG
jgi:transposase-like protein